MNINKKTKIFKEERTAGRTIGEKAAVIVIDEQKLHTLSPVGARIWEITEGQTFEQIIDVLEHEYDASREALETDVRSFIETLCKLGAMRIENES